MSSESEQEFQDPLENYEPPVYDDPLEEALMEEPVSAIHTQPFASVSPDTPVEVAIKQLVGQDIACLMVTENDKLVGIFSDRDVLDRVSLRYDEVKKSPVRDVMTPKPVHVHESDSAAAALCVMAARGYRHVPVLDADEKVVGIVSPHRVTEFLIGHFQDES